MFTAISGAVVSPVPDNPIDLWSRVQQIGLLPVFVYGLWRGWWFLKPHVDFLIGRIADLTEEVKQSRSQTGRSLELAETSHELAAQSVEETRALRATVQSLGQSVDALGAEVRALKAGAAARERSS